MEEFGNLKQSCGGGKVLKSHVESFKRLFSSANASPLPYSPQSKPIPSYYHTITFLSHLTTPEMPPPPTLARLSAYLPLRPSTLRPPTLCIRCQLRFSTLPPQLARPTLKQRLWQDPESPKAEPSPPPSPDPKADLRQGEYKPALTSDNLPSIGGNPGAEWERDHIWEGSGSLTHPSLQTISAKRTIADALTYLGSWQQQNSNRDKISQPRSTEL